MNGKYIGYPGLNFVGPNIWGSGLSEFCNF
ncbi:hypothetical protein LINPERHAP2_LOCUS26025 [Linum perenne]